MFDCYNFIIGLSQSDCDCTTEQRPADYNESKSGLFIDDLTSISRLLGLEECNKKVWDILEKARKNAITQFVADTNALLAKKYRLKRTPVKSQVLGQIKHKDTYSPTKNYASLTINCSPIKSGYGKLKSIGGIFTGTGAVQVQLRDNLNGLLDTYTLNTLPNKFVTTPVNKELPQHSKYMQPLEYYLVYMFDADNLPKATVLDCGCGGATPKFNRNSPHYENVGAIKKAPWTDYVMVGGREINSLSELEDDISTMSSNMFGLSLEMDFGCKVSEVLCDEALDFEGNPLALSMAIAIQKKAAVNVGNAILGSPLLNRENMIGSETWEEDILEWQTSYNENVNYIVSQADYTANDCLGCKDVHGLTRAGLFA